MQFGEFGGIIATKIDEEQFVGSTPCVPGQRDIEAVGLLDRAPAIQMQAFRIAPPLPAQILVAIFRRLPIEKRTSCSSTFELRQLPPT